MILSKRLRWTGHLASMEDCRGALKFLTSKHEGKSPLGKASGRWEDNVRMDLKKIPVNLRNFIGLAWDRDYWRDLMNGIEPPGSISHRVTKVWVAHTFLHNFAFPLKNL